jgi:hypothetical protein
MAAVFAFPETTFATASNANGFRPSEHTTASISEGRRVDIYGELVMTAMALFRNSIIDFMVSR